jgi:hypothetical protein
VNIAQKADTSNFVISLRTFGDELYGIHRLKSAVETINFIYAW